MTAIQNGNGTTVAEKANGQSNAVVTAVVVSKPDNGTKKAVNLNSDMIEPNNYNARKTFDPEALKELAQSISVQGLIQPITVRTKGNRYEIICGERRFRACRMLKMPEIPCIVREATDQQAYDLSISENLQREDVPPIEAAEAYKRLIDTKRYDITSLALQFGKSEKSVYNTLKLCDLIPGVAKLVKSGRLTASAGIVVSKYDKKIQADILKDRFGEDGRGDWCEISAGALEGKIQNCYTNKLEDYLFDKSKCLKCPHNSSNSNLFAEGNSCGRCEDKKCLDAKQTAYLVAQAEALALADPKLVFVGDQYSRGNEATQKIKNGGYEFKNVQTYDMKQYPTAPTAPQEAEYKKPEDFGKAQERYDKEQENYAQKTAKLDVLKEAGKIRVYAKISNDRVNLYYKEVKTKDVKSNEQMISELTAKKKRNSELACEKTAEDIKELLRSEKLPKSAFSPTEETVLYFFMLSKLRPENYKAVGYSGYSGRDYENRYKIALSLTEEQKTIVRRDFLYECLTSNNFTVADTKGGILLAFARQHLPGKTATIETTHKENYAKKNARLDERIAGLKTAEKKVKAEAKPKEVEQAAGAGKAPKKDEKAVKQAKKSATPTAPKTDAKEAVTLPTATAKTGSKPEAQPQAVKSEAKPAPVSDKVLVVGVPKPQVKPVTPTAKAVAVAG